MHNAPWNDWTPPSRSHERFLKAIAKKRPEVVDQRVRVRICASADTAGLNNSVVAFAAVEIDSGQKYLRLRRGGECLASILVHSLRVMSFGDHFVEVVPRARQRVRCSVYFSFDGEARKAKFWEMIMM